jgi:4-amino-4-deoxy-L-arabinose transferase-like glycosyltransferase
VADHATYTRGVTRARHPLLVPLALAAGVLTLHLACGGRLGFFRDELYFVACGQRLAWGYVDQPPLIALVARAAWWISGEGGSVALFRAPAYMAGAASVLVSALVARRLGGGRFSMALAAAATAGSALQLAQGHLLTMNVLELLLWNLTVLALLAALQGAGPAWLGAGALLGLALLTKYSAGLLAVALLLGLAATGARRALASRWALAGMALAAALALPALLWQLDHGLPFLELLRNGRLHKNAEITPAMLLSGLLLEQGPLGLLLAAAGAFHLLARREGREARWLGVAMVLVLLAFALAGGKPYYLGPVFPPLFAAGSVLAEIVFPAWRPLRAAAVALAAGLVLPAVPIAIPLLEPAATVAWMERLGVAPVRTERSFTQPLPQHQADQLGWPGQVAAVRAVVAGLPPGERARSVVYTTNYGRAAALQLLGRGLPPVISGHNQYFLWGVPGAPTVVVALGGRAEDYAGDFSEVSLAGRTPALPDGMRYESEVPVYLLRGPRAPVADLFRTSKSYQ